MEDPQAVLNVAMRAQLAFMVIGAFGMAVGVATAGKTPRIGRQGFIIMFVIAFALIFPSFLILQPLVAPELDFSDPNPDDAALVQAASLMGYAAIPSAILIGRYTAYRNRDVGNAERMAYLAAVPVIGSIWALRLLFKPSATAAPTG